MVNIKIKYIMIIMAILLFWSPAHAEYYKYKDNDGVTRFTDDLSQVPADQRPEVKAYEEIQSVEIKAVDRGGDKPAVEGVKEDSDNPAEETGDLAELKQMNKRKAELDEEYAALVSEKEELIKMKEGAKTQDMLEAYTEKTVDLNDRISQYEIRRQAFAKEVDEFNRKMKP